MSRLLRFFLAFSCVALAARNVFAIGSPLEMASALERRIVSGDGVTLPDADAEVVRHAGTVDLAEGDWPAAFHARAGETVCVAVSPFTGNYEFFDESGECFFELVPVLPTTQNWVAPFRHTEGGTYPDDDLYAPWRLVDVWYLSHAEFAESAEFVSRAENAETLVTRHSSLVTRGAEGPATDLCFTAFSYTATNLYFTAAWPTNEPLPDATLDLYGTTNLLSPFWTFLSSHPATNPPVEFAVAPASLPWYVAPTQHVHGASCESITNIVLSPLDGTSVYTNVFWSCSTNRAPHPPGLFRLGTRHDTDGDGLPDAREMLVAGSDPANPDTDGDGVPDGRTAEQWLAHPLWAHNGDCTNLVVFLYEPITNGVAALRFDDLCIPLASNAGPWCLCLPTNAVVDCELVAEPGVVVMLWYGPPEAAVSNRSLAPDWNVPSSVAVPIWCDDPMAVFGGNDWGGGSCRFARPTLRVRTGEPGQDGGLGVCVHAPDGIARFTWSVEPAVCTGLVAVGTGAVETDESGPGFSIDVSDAVPGPAGTRGGVLSVHSWQQPFFGTPVLWGDLSEAVSAHLCEFWSDGLAFCLSCGGFHRPFGSPPCLHAAWCATKSSLETNCDCAQPFVRIGAEGSFVLAADDGACCPVHAGASNPATLLQAPQDLGASVANGVLGVAPGARSPTIGGFVARYRILDDNGGVYRDLSLPFTCADLGIDPCLSNAQTPYEWQEAGPDAYYLQNGTFYIARRSAPYPIRLWNESPSDARLVFSFDSPTNGPALFDSSLVTRHSSLVTTNAAPFSALNDDRTVYLDASCSNALATLSLALSDPATNRTFLSESLSVQVIDTTIREEWRARSASGTLSWDFSDAPEDVWIGVGHAGPDGVLMNTLQSASSKTPSLSLDLPPGDYALEAYFPRVYDGVSAAAWSTNTLHVRPIPEFARDVVGVQCGSERRVNIALTNDTFHSDVQWTLSPVVADGPRLFATSNSIAAATSMSGVSNLWVSAGAVPGVYRVTASYPGFTNATAYVIDPIIDINGDFFRNGTIADDPREAEPVSFTNAVGIVIPCNNDDSDEDEIPDCDDLVVNGASDLADLGTIVLRRFGLSQTDLPPGASLTAEIDVTVPEDDLLTIVPASTRIRFFGSSETNAMALGGEAPTRYENLASDLFGATNRELRIEGRLHGATVLLSLRVRLEGEIIGEDTIRVRVVPFEVLSNCDVAETLFVSNIGDAPWNAFAEDMVATAGDVVDVVTNNVPITFCQDLAEFGWTDVGSSGRPDIWALDEQSFLDILDDSTGWFGWPIAAGWGGNIEASPPTALHPNGRIIVGTNLPGHVKAFLKAQEVQTDGGELLELPVSWLNVGHVDEVMAIVPVSGANGFSVLVGDLDLALELLREEISLCQEWLADNPEDVEVQHDLEVLSAKIAPYDNPANASLTNLVSSNLSIVRTRLSSGLGMQVADLVRIPCLYPLPGIRSTGWSNTEELWSNPINMVVLVTATEQRRILLPDVQIEAFSENISSALHMLGYDDDEIVFIDTTGPRGAFGEAHCASNVQRRRNP